MTQPVDSTPEARTPSIRRGGSPEEERETRALRWRRGPPPTLAVFAALLEAACSRSNDLLLGRVQAEVGGHTVVVTDCYRLRVPPPVLPPAGGEAAVGYRFAPCRDAVVTIRGDTLTVNGHGYGRLAPGEPVLVDHGVVEPGRD